MVKGVRRWFRLPDVERDVDEEIAFHFRELIRDLEGQGLSSHAARLEASRQFGDERRYRRELVLIGRQLERKTRWGQTWQAVRDALRFAVRNLVRAPALSLGIVLAFGLGLGANVTMYGTVERMLIRAPAHVADPDGVRRLAVNRLDGAMRIHATTVTFPDYAQDFVGTAAFGEVAAYRSLQLVAGAGESAEPVQTVLATASYWPLLGVVPVLGRFFTATEDQPGAAPVAVISYARWQREHGGAHDVLGSTIDFGHGPYTVIGVTPSGFTGVDLGGVDYFLPVTVASTHVARGSTQWREHRGWFIAQVLVRLAPGVSIASAELEATVRHRLGRAETAWYDTDARIVLAPLLVARGPNVPAEAVLAKWLLAVAVIVLLIACLNVANLLLARTLRQRREIAIRLALGIPRSRLVMQIMIEGALLGVAGGVLALLLAYWGGTYVQNVLLPDVAWSSIPSVQLLLLVLAAAVAAGAGSAIAPAVQASRRPSGDGLRASSGSMTRSTSSLRAALAMTQSALSVLLLVGAGLFVRSLDNVRRTQLGESDRDIAVATPTFAAGGIEPEARWQYFDAAAERLAQLPGVEAVSIVSGMPFRTAMSYPLRADGIDSVPAGPTGGPFAHAVDHEYFHTLGLRLERGRLFDQRDTRASPRVVVISTAFARALWPHADAVGRCLYIGDSDAGCSEIIGVVEGTRQSSLVEEPSYQYFMLIHQRQLNHLPDALIVRLRGASRSPLVALQRELTATDPRVRFARAQPLEELFADELRQWRLGAALFSAFGLLALLVAAIGLYSLLAFDVAQRVREIGLRAALGASRAALMTFVVRRAMRITAIGIGAGAAIAALLAPRLQDLIYGIGPRDPVTFAIVAITLLVVSAAASSLPAWRASRLDPNAALRSD